MTDRRGQGRSIRRTAVLALVAALAAAPAARGDWRAARDSAEVARVARDWPRYAVYLDSVYAGLGNHPTVIWAQGRAAARLGDPARAFERIGTYAAMGLSRSLAADSAFTPYAARPEYAALVARL